MARHPGIPLDIQAEVQKLVEEFNLEKFKKVKPLLRILPGGDVNKGYAARFKGKFFISTGVIKVRFRPYAGDLDRSNGQMGFRHLQIFRRTVGLR